MAWPKGKPRKPTAEAPAAASTPLQAAQQRWNAEKSSKMKARPNWEDYVEDADGPENRLHIARDKFPDGMDLQWVAVSCMGQELADERAAFERKGWTPVHQSDWDGLFDGRWMKKGQEGEINYNGLVLMARPLEYSIKAKKRDLAEARERVAMKEAALRGGDIPTTLDSQHPTALRSNVINKTVERLTIPEE